MKIAIASSSDTGGGAFIAASRLLDGLGDLGVDTSMLVVEKRSRHPRIHGSRFWSGWVKATHLSRKINKLPLLAYPKRQPGMWTYDWISYGIAKRLRSLRPDVINLHWIHLGGLKFSEMRCLDCPTMWTLHDMAAFTGGCHYTDQCERWLAGCGACPQLGSTRVNDLSTRGYRARHKAFLHRMPMFVCPSQWLAQQASRSPLLANARIEVVPNGLDLNTFRPHNALESRSILGLPTDRRLVLFGATDPQGDKRKGFHLLLDALELLRSHSPPITLLVFGSKTPANNHRQLPLPAIHLGPITDQEKLARIYSAADIFVAPSLVDNLPNTIAEALACGTPCAAFAVGGIPEMILHERTGSLAKPGSPRALADSISWVISQPDPSLIRAMCREHATQHYDQRIMASRYLALAHSLMQERPSL